MGCTTETRQRREKLCTWGRRKKKKQAEESLQKCTGILSIHTVCLSGDRH